MKIIIAFAFFLPAFQSFAGLSAHRDAAKTAEAYYPTGFHATKASGSAFSRKVAYSKMNLNAVAEAPDFSFVQKEFLSVRDQRFLVSPDDSSFLRRISWLYPDDGCYARAEMFARSLAEQKAVAPSKIFIFGNLSVETPNAPDGQVTWWYHVAIAYRTAEGVFILDPSVQPKNPMALADWVHLISPGAKEPKLSICTDKSFDPDSDCSATEGIAESEALSQAQDFLPSEWDRMIELRRDPKRVLGEFPPWLQPLH